MQLLLESPAALTGLCAERNANGTVLRFGETVLDLQKAAPLFKNAAAPTALLNVMASLGALPVEVNGDGAAHLQTENGAVQAVFDRNTHLLQTLEIDGAAFRFLHSLPQDA